MAAAIPPNDAVSKVSRPARSIRAAASADPPTLTAPTAAEARAPLVTPACAKTDEEKYTIALMPANCWRANRAQPVSTPREDASSPAEIGEEAWEEEEDEEVLVAAASSAGPAGPHNLRAAASAAAPWPRAASQRGDSGASAMPTASRAAGTSAAPNMVRQADAGRATLARRAPKMPTQMTSWLTDPSAPRTRAGATSEM
jgi:hypothetical protein